MSSLPTDRNRRLVPRWRPSTVLIRQDEAKPLVENPHRVPVTNADAKAAHASWLADPSIELAAEVVINSATSGEPYLAFGPAEQILRNKDNVAPALVDLAQHLRYGHRPEEPLAPKRTNSIRDSIGLLRRRLREYSRDPFAWLDLALLYTRLGEDEAAKRAARTSLGLAPDNRLVVRSYTRLFLHLEEADEALRLVRRSELAPHDPWLAGLEIELSDLLGKTPRLLRRANDLLRTFEDRPNVVTELAASLGTTTALQGSLKLARAHFRRALQQPNENVVAQARWISHNVPGAIQFDGMLLQEEARFEARAQHYYQAGKWEAAVSEIERWLEDESFSSRPAILGSFVAGSLLRDYSRAAQIAERGLVANPHNATLRNNLAFALARGPTPQLALKHLGGFPLGAIGEERVFLTATRGLVEMKLGNEDEGRRLYEGAIAAADSIKSFNHSVLARLHFAVTELESLTPSYERVGQLMIDAAKFGKQATIDKIVLKGLVSRITELLLEPGLPFDDETRARLSNLGRFAS